MNLRRMLLGDAKGKTGWQRVKESWAGEKKREAQARAFAKLHNPLGLNIGDKLDLAEAPEAMYEVKGIIDCRSEQQNAMDPTHLRYLLKHVADDIELCIEATHKEGETFYTQFEEIDEFEFDENFLNVLESEPELRQTISGNQGSGDQGQEQLDYQKESDGFLSLTMHHQEGIQSRDVRSFNYFRQSADDEEYLLVEIDDADGWTTIQLGRPLLRSAITAYGAVTNP